MSGPDTVCVAIPNTGRTSGILNAVEAALELGCLVIGLSGEECPLLDLADISLRASTFEDRDVYTPSTSRLAALAVIDILATGVAIRLPSEHVARLRIMKHELSNLCTGRNVMPKLPEVTNC
jgi:RpiR family carbohydrate utilization transcriptional regulator